MFTFWGYFEQLFYVSECLFSFFFLLLIYIYIYHLLSFFLRLLLRTQIMSLCFLLNIVNFFSSIVVYVLGNSIYSDFYRQGSSSCFMLQVQQYLLSLALWFSLLWPITVRKNKIYISTLGTMPLYILY